MLCSCDSDTDAVDPRASRVMSSNMPCSYRAKNGVCAMIAHRALILLISFLSSYPFADSHYTVASSIKTVVYSWSLLYTYTTCTVHEDRYFRKYFRTCTAVRVHVQRCTRTVHCVVRTEIWKYFRKYESKLLSYNKVHVVVVFYEGTKVFSYLFPEIFYFRTKVRKYESTFVQ